MKQRNSKGNTSTNTPGGMKQDRENQMKALKQKLLGKKINLNMDNSNIIDDENDVGRNRKNKGYYKESSYVQPKKKIDHEAIFEKRHNKAKDEIKDFDFQCKMTHIEFIDSDKRKITKPLPTYSQPISENHWVGHIEKNGQFTSKVLHPNYI